MARPQTLLDKLWKAHLIRPESSDHPAMIYVDLHLLHEVSAVPAFRMLEQRKLSVRRPDRCVAMIDHAVPTRRFEDGSLAYASVEIEAQIREMEAQCDKNGIVCLGLDDKRRGIVHVVAPELGMTQPGQVIVCGDSHTTTHGAFGALALGIGTSDVMLVLATQALLLRKPKAGRIYLTGKLSPQVRAKDLALHMVRTLGSKGAVDHILEFQGPLLRDLDMDQRMTLCNMTVEAGARGALIAPDGITLDYLKTRWSSKESFKELSVAWRTLYSDDGVSFSLDTAIDAADVKPSLTYGTVPSQSVAVGKSIPKCTSEQDLESLRYMGFEEGELLEKIRIDTVFVGSCTNGRLSDLRDIGEVLRVKSIAAGVKMIVVPGSLTIKREAEEEGLAEIFLRAGAEWREPGCSYCVALNGDQLEPGQICVSTSNRNFPGRQGPQGRVILASPRIAAIAATLGRLPAWRDI